MSATWKKAMVLQERGYMKPVPSGQDMDKVFHLTVFHYSPKWADYSTQALNPNSILVLQSMCLGWRHFKHILVVTQGMRIPVVEGKALETQGPHSLKQETIVNSSVYWC